LLADSAQKLVRQDVIDVLVEEMAQSGLEQVLQRIKLGGATQH
jgi:hypothetical protein